MASQYSNFANNVFHQVDKSSSERFKKTTYLANQFVLSKPGAGVDGSARHFLGIKPDYRTNPTKAMVAMATDNDRQFAIGNADGEEICFHITNLSSISLIVVMEHASRTKSNIHLRPGQYYCMDNYNITDKSHFGIKKKVKSDGTSLTVKETRDNRTSEQESNTFTFTVLVECDSTLAENPIIGAAFTATDFITVVESVQPQLFGLSRNVFAETIPLSRRNAIADTPQEEDDDDVLDYDDDDVLDYDDDTPRVDSLLRKSTSISIGQNPFLGQRSQSLIDAASHTTTFTGGRSTETLGSAFVGVFDTPVILSVTVCINEDLTVTRWVDLDLSTQRAIIDEFLGKKLSESVKKVYVEANCVVCLDAVPTQTLAVCGHSCLCSECCPIVTTCPLCRRLISGTFSLSAS